MKSITYFCKEKPDHILIVSDYRDNQILLWVEGQTVVLNALQVDKLRQQFHGWLHERANEESGANWTEESDDV